MYIVHIHHKNYKNRGFGRVRYTNPSGAPGCDHIGLNYYSRGLVDWRLFPVPDKGETMTDMPYALHPEGLAVALKGVAVLGVPIYITETGVADKGDSIRPQMIQSYMSAVEEAVRSGVDLRGIMYWTLVDNFEWSFGFKMHFGMFNFDHKTQERTMHQSASQLAYWFKRLKEKAPLWRDEVKILDGGVDEKIKPALA